MTGSRSLVSIAVPVHDATSTIREAIESALAQTYDALEMVVGDNASTDDTRDLVRSCGQPRPNPPLQPAPVFAGPPTDVGSILR